MRLWWALLTALVYLYLACFTWVFEQRAYAAQRPRLKPRSFGQMEAPGGDDEDEAEEEGQEEAEEEEARPARGPSGGSVTYQKIRRVPEGYLVELGFRNFNKNNLQMRVQLGSETVAESIREFGYRRTDFTKLDAWYKTAQESAISAADKKMFRGNVTAPDQTSLNRKMAEVKASNARLQEELDKALKAITEGYKAKRTGLYTQGGFHFQKQGVVEVDLPAVVRGNWKRMRPVAQAMAQIAQSKGYDAEDLVGAVVAMVQTSLPYEIPPEKDGDRVIGGFWPPPESLVLGKGDCDTKTALIASILANWPNVKMVGLAIPEHYLMAVHRIPRSGDVFIEHEGIPYVMIESAGPAWIPPGTVGDFTEQYLKAGHEFRIQPI